MTHGHLFKRDFSFGCAVQSCRDEGWSVDIEEIWMQSLPDEKRKIPGCKRLRLLEKMIIDEGYPDKTLPGDIAQGFFWLDMLHLPLASFLQSDNLNTSKTRHLSSLHKLNVLVS